MKINPTSNYLINPKLFERIRDRVMQTRHQLQRSVNATMVQTYWDIGRMIVEEEQAGESRAAYGKAQLQTLANQLSKQLGKGFDATNLRNMRQFYQLFPIRDAVRSELSWTHYRILIRIKSVQARNWYLQEAINEDWSSRALERQIGTFYYERLLSSKERQPVEDEAKTKTQPLALDPKDYLRDPYILDFLNLDGKRYRETDLEQGIIGNLQKFLLELGKGFAFVERQQRMRFEDQDFYIDLVFYNFKLKCFLLIDLKIGVLSHQDVGQMDTYVRVYDQHKKGNDDKPTIGLVLCSEKRQAVAKYSMLADNEQLFAAEYLPYLPTEEELKVELERERRLIQQQLSNDSSHEGDA